MATSPNSLPGRSGKYGDLKRRLIFMVLALVVYRIGVHIPIPGIDPTKLSSFFARQSGGILGMFNMFSGGALARATIFALGITPYISASIVMQLLSVAIPSAREPEKGRRVGSPQDYPVHALRHAGTGSSTRFWYFRMA